MLPWAPWPTRPPEIITRSIVLQHPIFILSGCADNARGHIALFYFRLSGVTPESAGAGMWTINYHVDNKLDFGIPGPNYSNIGDTAESVGEALT